MIALLAKIGAFLFEHGEVFEAVVDALDSGTPKEAILSAIRSSMTGVSDAALREEFDAAEDRKRGE